MLGRGCAGIRARARRGLLARGRRCFHTREIDSVNLEFRRGRADTETLSQLPTSPELDSSMIICSCHGITDGELRRELGPDGRGPCRAGTSCGNCLPLVTHLTEELRSSGASHEKPAPRTVSHPSPDPR
jgi:bacterioferritin-associated ferredoxin